MNEESEDDQYSPPAQPSPPRALFTHEPQEDTQQSNAARFNIERPKPVQQQAQQVYRPAPAAQPQRPRAHHFEQEQREQRPHQKAHSSEDKPKKPVAQILKKYREEHPDGSITWGFENDDGELYLFLQLIKT